MSSARSNVHMHMILQHIEHVVDHLQGVMIKHSAVVAVVAGMRAFLSQVCAQCCACHGQHCIL